MTQDQQETLNEIFLGKEDPDMAFKPMTNNLKEIEDILDFTITYRFYDEVPNIQGKLLEFRGKITEEASERILTLINQKEKEARIDELEKISGFSNATGVATVASGELGNLRDRIKQLKEELNKEEQL